jgi:hypothetical protein
VPAHIAAGSVAGTRAEHQRSVAAAVAAVARFETLIATAERLAPAAAAECSALLAGTADVTRSLRAFARAIAGSGAVDRTGRDATSTAAAAAAAPDGTVPPADSTSPVHPPAASAAPPDAPPLTFPTGAGADEPHEPHEPTPAPAAPRTRTTTRRCRPPDPALHHRTTRPPAPPPTTGHGRTLTAAGATLAAPTATPSTTGRHHRRQAPPAGIITARRSGLRPAAALRSNRPREAARPQPRLTPDRSPLPRAASHEDHAVGGLRP